VAPGYVLLSADYSMIELRLMAHFSKDESLLAALRSGGDPMKDVAASMYAITSEQVTMEQRSHAKGVVYGRVQFQARLIHIHTHTHTHARTHMHIYACFR
jgi:DNA polymerase-1